MATVAAEPLATDLFLDPFTYQRAPGREAAPEVAGLLDALAGEAGSVERCFVLVFANGHPLFPTDSDLFSQDAAFAGRDPLAALLAAAEERSVEVYAMVEALRWAEPGTPPEADLFVRRPDLQERSGTLACGFGSEGKFASPFHPEVRQLLTDLVDEIGQKYPGLAGLLLDCRLSLREFLSYSPAARIGFIRAYHRDPMDVRLNPHSERGWKALSDLQRWRITEVARLVGDLAAAFRQRQPAGRVVARGFSNYYRWTTGGVPNWVCQDWLNWAAAGRVDEVLLEARWWEPEGQESLRLARRLLRRAELEVPTVPLLYTPSRGQEVTPHAAQLGVLQAQTTVDRIAVEVRAPADLEPARQFLAEKREVVEVEEPDPDRLRGDELLRQGRNEEAVAAYQMAVDRDQDLVAAYRGMGDAYRNAGQHQRAIEAYQKLLEVAPQDELARLEIGNCYAYSGRYEEALQAYQSLLQENPQHALALLGIGNVYAAQRKFEEAIAWLKRAAEAAPRDVRTHFFPGQSLLRERPIRRQPGRLA